MQVAERLALETAKVERLFLAGKAPAPGNPKPISASPDASPERGRSSCPPPPQDAVPTMAATAFPTDASQDARPMNEGRRAPQRLLPRRLPRQGRNSQRSLRTRSASATGRVSEQLRSHSSSDELVRFANELGCKKLLPQVVTLMERLAPPPAGADVSTAAPPDTQAGSVAAGPAPACGPRRRCDSHVRRPANDENRLAQSA